jgi:hypothetical protein
VTGAELKGSIFRAREYLDASMTWTVGA